SPSDAKMDGAFRTIDIKTRENNYKLSYRRGYFAREESLPGAAQASQQEAAQHASQDPTKIDPLAPFMDFGMPQSEQILYKTKIKHSSSSASGVDQSDLKGNTDRYLVDFAVDLNDLNLKPDSDGIRKGKLNVTLIVYDRYGKVANREDRLVNLNVKPDVYEVFQKTGVQLHGAIAVPKGQY